MIDFFVEGGALMWPLLVFSLVLLGASGRYAWAPDPRRIRFIVAMGVVVLAVTVHASLIDIAKVLSFAKTLSEPDRTTLLLEGIKESSRPAALAGAAIAVAALLVAVGAFRAGRRETRGA
jgi:hypothetical protein